jgi:hypothetical protein
LIKPVPSQGPAFLYKRFYGPGSVLFVQKLSLKKPCITVPGDFPSFGKQFFVAVLKQLSTGTPFMKKCIFVALHF